MVEVFRGVWNVLRDDGTAWLNLGDSYAGSGKGPHGAGSEFAERTSHNNGTPRANINIRPKSLIGIPWRVALALQTDGWILRSDIIWAKKAPMPESVQDRPTRSHEHVFLLTKQARYYYDAVAVQEPILERPRLREKLNGESAVDTKLRGYGSHCGTYESGKNKRDVWHLSPEPFPDAHFAVFPRALVEPCLLAGTSAHGVCGACGAPYTRVVDRTSDPDPSYNGSRFDTGKTGINGNGRVQPGERYLKQSVGWRPTCICNAPRRPAVVLDPFGGSGTVLAVAKQHDRSAISIELNPGYVNLQKKRLRSEPAHQFQLFV